MKRLFVRSMLALAFVAGMAQAAGPPPTDQELQKFVAASIEVHNINQDSQSAQAKAKSGEEATKLDDEASERMEKAVIAKGMSTERFTQIYETMQNDPKVRARVTEIARKQTGSK